MLIILLCRQLWFIVQNVSRCCFYTWVFVRLLICFFSTQFLANIFFCKYIYITNLIICGEFLLAKYPTTDLAECSSTILFVTTITNLVIPGTILTRLVFYNFFFIFFGPSCSWSDLANFFAYYSFGGPKKKAGKDFWIFCPGTGKKTC